MRTCPCDSGRICACPCQISSSCGGRRDPCVSCIRIWLSLAGFGWQSGIISVRMLKLASLPRQRQRSGNARAAPAVVAISVVVARSVAVAVGIARPVGAGGGALVVVLLDLLQLVADGQPAQVLLARQVVLQNMLQPMNISYEPLPKKSLHASASRIFQGRKPNLFGIFHLPQK